MDDCAIDIRNQLQKRRNEIALRLANGGCEDFADYKSKTGRIKGLDDAIEAINKTLRNQEIVE